MKNFLPIMFIMLLFPTTIHAQSFDYDKCIENAARFGFEEEAKCKHTQTLIDLKNMQSLYDTFANDDSIKSLNAAGYRKMYDSWLQYRNSYCELYAEASYEYNKQYNKTHCLFELTRNAYLYMNVIYTYLYSDRD